MHSAPNRARASLAPWAALALALSGCATDYVARTESVRRSYQAQDYDGALAQLRAQAKEDCDEDALLYLLDEGMLLHASGRWAESNRVLEEAEKTAARLDVISVSEEAMVLLSNEREKAYRGEDFEKLLINVFKALNYAQLGQDEEALVEVRRVNERLRKMVSEEKKPYEQLAIARYLGGVLYEDAGELDSAFIDYAEAEKLMGSSGQLAEPLLRLAAQTGRDEQLERLKRRYPGVEAAPLGKDEGQLVVVAELGLSPEKYSATPPDDVELVAIPSYRTRPYAHGRAVLRAAGQEAQAERITSIEEVARIHLNDRVGRMIAKSAASTAIKAGLAVGAAKATDNEAVGMLAFLLLSSTNKPDLRSWLSLPAEFQIARMRLPAGEHEIVVETPGGTEKRKVTIAARRIATLIVRRY